MSSDLPRGWALSTLDEIRFDQSSGMDPSKSPDECFELYSVPSFEVGRPEIVAGGEIGSSKQTVLPRTVLLCKINPRINRAWIVDDYTDHKKIASTEWIPFFPVKSLEPKFLCYFLSRHQMRDFLASRASGVGGSLMRVKPSILEGCPIPIAPLPEQHRIVAEIEKHFTRLEASVAGLKRAQANLKRYRAAVLKAACEGRLVPTEAELARAESRDYEPADVLLDRILKERRAKWEADQLAKMQAIGKEPKDDGWKAKYEEPTAPDTRGLPELPEGWAWTAVGQLSQVGTGATPLRSNSAFYGGSIPWVTSGALNSPFIDHAEEFITELALSETNTKIFPRGSLLVAMYGEGKTRGKVSELRIEAATNQACAALVFDQVASACRPFIKLFLMKNYDDIRRESSGGVQPNLNLSIVRNTAVPLPPLDEQRRIVADVERRLSVVDELDTTADQSLKRAGRLRQAVLKRAFQGRLVPQDPNDEPASVLLERIRAERAAQGQARNNRRGRRASRKRRTPKTPARLTEHQTGVAE